MIEVVFAQWKLESERLHKRFARAIIRAHEIDAAQSACLVLRAQIVEPGEKAASTFVNKLTGVSQRASDNTLSAQAPCVSTCRTPFPPLKNTPPECAP